MPTVEPYPDERTVGVPFVISKKGFFPNKEELQKELAKKYPVKTVKTIQILRRNPYHGNVPETVLVIIYLAEKIVGPPLKRLVNHVSKLLMEQMDKKFPKAKRPQPKTKVKTKAKGR
jgi:hypothetical protein